MRFLKIAFLCFLSISSAISAIGQCYTNPEDPDDHDFPAPIYSNPQIFPESDLLISNPLSDQLNPNLIHVIILGDGYNILNEEYSESSIYEVTSNDQLSTQIVDGQNIALFKLFDNSVTSFGLFNLSGDPLVNFNGAGEANNLIDFMTGNAARNIEGFTPYKEYRDFFRFYKVLYNSEENGIGHPNHDGSLNLTIDCDDGDINPPLNKSTFWGNELDFCNTHRGIKADFQKIECFTDKYFSTLASQGKVFVIVLSNTSHFGAAANIPKQICSTVGNYSIEFEDHFVNCTSDLYNDFDERVGMHEFSHIFAKLQDEYFFPYESSNCVQNYTEEQFYSGPNRFWFDTETPTNQFPFTSTNSEIGGLPWNHWSIAPTQSIEISNYRFGLIDQCTGVQSNTYEESVRKPTLGYELNNCGYVPSNSCIMENLYGNFCAVCREAIVMKIHDLISPINSVSPLNGPEDVYEASSSLSFSLDLTTPNPNTVRVTWELVDENDEATFLETDYNGAGQENGNNGLAGGSPSGVYQWNMVCDVFDGLSEGDYTIRARVFDMTGESEEDEDRWVRHPDYEINSMDPEDENYEEIVEWKVHFSGFVDYDLYAIDRAELGADEYTSGSYNLWSSPNLWLCNDNFLDCDSDGDAPEYDGPGAEAQVNILIKNRGCRVFEASEENGTVDFWWAKAKTNLEWPEDWDGDLIEQTTAFEGNFISTVDILEDIDIANSNGVVVNTLWDIPNPDDYADLELYSEEITHFCFLAIIDADDDLAEMIDDGNEYRLYRSVLQSNNIVWRNVSIIDKFDAGSSGTSSATDVIRGGAVIVSNNDSIIHNYKLKFEVPTTEIGKPITEEAEIRIILSDSLWSKWITGGQQGSQIAKYDSTLHQLILEDTLASIAGLTLDSNSHFGLFVSANFLTQERTSKEHFKLEVTQILDDTTQRVLGGETYVFKPDPMRSLFSADAGNDKEVIVGEGFSQIGKTISDSALYNWYDSNGNRIFTGSTLTDTTTTTSTETYKLEIIAKYDGYKDYDEVTITSTLGIITSVVPNPISSGSLTINYKVATSATSPKIRIVNVSTSAFTEHSISTGTGTLNVDISSYASGSHSILLICNSTTVDDELLVVQ